MLSYIRDIINVGFFFEKDDHGKQECTGHVDSDYAGDLEKRQSTTEYVFTLSYALVSWHCTLQSTMALSMIEAEYMTLTEAVKDNLGIEHDFLRVNCDSMTVTYLVKN